MIFPESQKEVESEPGFKARSCGWTMRLSSLFMGYRATGRKSIIFVIFIFRISAQLNWSIDLRAGAFETSVD